MLNVNVGIDIIPVKKSMDLIMQISKLAKIIYLNHYIKCINKTCAKRMYDTYQTPNAIIKAIDSGENYFIVKIKDKNIGYFAINPYEDKLFLSKLYLDPSVRGCGIGKYILNILINLSQELEIPHIELFVSKTNPTVNIYKKLGFKIIKDVFTDSGQGLIEDDYLMQLDI